MMLTGANDHRPVDFMNHWSEFIENELNILVVGLSLYRKKTVSMVSSVTCINGDQMHTTR